MKKSIVNIPAMKLIGIAARTNNRAEMSGDNAVIPETIQEFYHNGFAQSIPSSQPNRTYHIYTEYDDRAHADYTFFIGKEVLSFADVSAGCRTLDIPQQTYVKFTSPQGVMPAVCIDMWKKIWTMQESDFGGKRAYIADFEIYDERSHDPMNAALDICLGIDAKG